MKPYVIYYEGKNHSNNPLASVTCTRSSKLLIEMRVRRSKHSIFCRYFEFFLRLLKKGSISIRLYTCFFHIQFSQLSKYLNLTTQLDQPIILKNIRYLSSQNELEYLSICKSIKNCYQKTKEVSRSFECKKILCST